MNGMKPVCASEDIEHVLFLLCVRRRSEKKGMKEKKHGKHDSLCYFAFHFIFVSIPASSILIHPLHSESHSLLLALKAPLHALIENEINKSLYENVIQVTSNKRFTICFDLAAASETTPLNTPLRRAAQTHSHRLGGGCCLAARRDRESIGIFHSPVFPERDRRFWPVKPFPRHFGSETPDFRLRSALPTFCECGWKD